MVELYQRDAVWLYAFFPKEIFLNNSWVHNNKRHGISKATLKYTRVDEAERAQKQRLWNQPVTWPLYAAALFLLSLLLPGSHRLSPSPERHGQAHTGITMLAYIIRRLFYAIPILIGVNLLTFILFFVVNSPEDMAVSQLGQKYVTPAAIQAWKQKNGYDLPLFFNPRGRGSGALTETIFFSKSLRLFAFDFGRSESGRDITTDVSTRMWPSLAVALPTFVVGIWVNICVALMVVMFHATRLDRWAVFVFVALMSISYLFYIIGGQFLVAKTWKLVPISGFHAEGQIWKFLILPVLVGVVAGIGSGARWYRTLFLEEANQDYVRTARAKGASELRVLFRHILPNALIPILTGVVVVIPSLFMGGLLIESFFGIPGLGSYMLDAINAQDFAIVRSMVFIGSILYIVGLILTDISYTWADPRLRLD